MPNPYTIVREAVIAALEADATVVADFADGNMVFLDGPIKPAMITVEKCPFLLMGTGVIGQQRRFQETTWRETPRYDFALGVKGAALSELEQRYYDVVHCLKAAMAAHFGVAATTGRFGWDLTEAALDLTEAKNTGGYPLLTITFSLTAVLMNTVA